MQGSVLNHLNLGICPEDAERVWPGPKDLGSSVKYNNAAIEDPRTRWQFEAAVGELTRQQRNNIPPSLAQRAFVCDVLAAHGIEVKEA